MADQREPGDSIEISDRSDMESRTEENHELLNKDERDVEAQATSAQTTTTTPLEYTVSTSRKLTFLGLYFLLNLSVTLSNKALLRQVCMINCNQVIATDYCLGIISMAPDVLAYACHFDRMHDTASYGADETLQVEPA